MTARAIFLWHLHQPEYRDPLSGQPLLPWVRLHATRAYSDMAAALERHERVKCAVNWAPSLLLQLEAYVAGAAVDLDEQIARRPVESLSPAERAHVLRQSFSVDWELWVKPVPRYWELLQKRGAELKRVDLHEVQAQFSLEELRDLQVHFLLGWMGFAARAEEPLVKELILRERGFSESDKLALLDTERRIAARILPRWRALEARGQVEITCSPLFHPILPLLCDSEIARRAMPQAQLPPRFAHPEDAREQIRRGLDVAERAFGKRPVGMWPSEGSVAPEVLELFAQENVRWIATDEGILAQSKLAEDAPPLPKDTPANYRSYRSGPDGKVIVFFRDRDISDAIGFRYARGEALPAAQDLLRRISGSGDTCITIALDGENPWEHYPRSGETFLDAFYGLCERQTAVQLVLPREEIAARPPQARISRIHSGSWIDANYRIWIGHPEDNAAWALLGEARRALDEHAAAAGPEAAEKARMALFAAEGSDWFWWYGDDFTTENAVEFDALFRRWVGAAYRFLKLPSPEKLSIPIIGAHKDTLHMAAVQQEPRRLIAPRIDGYHVGYYEWAGAGLYRPPQQGVSMYRGATPLSQLLWGFGKNSELFVRLDPNPGAELRGEVRVHLSSANGEHQARMQLLPGGDESEVVDERGGRVGAGRTGAIVELVLQLERLGLRPGDEVRLWVRVLRDEVEVDRLPRYADLRCTVPGREFEPKNWQV